MQKIEIDEIVEICQDFSTNGLLSRSARLELARLVEQASGVDAPDSLAYLGCKTSTCREVVTKWQEAYEEHKRYSGREFPPLYRVKITVEAEELSPEDTKKEWEARQEIYRQAWDLPEEDERHE